MKAMLHGRLVKYQNLSFVSIGIALGGLIAAIICNLGFTRGILGFCMGSIFLLISVIFQMCALRSKLLPMLEEDENQRPLMKKANTKMQRLAVGVIAVNLSLFAFFLPLAIFSQGGYTGLSFGTWLGYGLLFAGITLVIVYAIYAFCIRERFAKKETLYMEEAYWVWMKEDKKLLKKALKTALAIAIVLGIISGVIYNLAPAIIVKPIVFETVEEFQLYMEENTDNYYADGWDVTIVPVREETEQEEAEEPLAQALGKDGEVLFEYAEGNFYHYIRYDAKEGMPIELYLKEDWNRVLFIRDRISMALGILIVIELVGFTALYLIYDY